MGCVQVAVLARLAAMRALIVDDSSAARAQARMALEDAMDRLGCDWTIDEAANGIEAVRLLASAEVHVLLVDLRMPDMTGLEVLAFWRTRGSAAPRRALIVSQDISSRDREKGLAGGAAGFLLKPVSSAVLAEALAGLDAAP